MYQNQFFPWSDAVPNRLIVVVLVVYDDHIPPSGEQFFRIARQRLPPGLRVIKAPAPDAKDYFRAKSEKRKATN